MSTTLEDVSGKTRFTLSVEMAMSEEQERAGYTQILEPWPPTSRRCPAAGRDHR
jgi:hypothetical protein